MVFFPREREASAIKKLIAALRDGFRLLNTASFLTFHKLKMATMNRAPRSFLAFWLELVEREFHLAEAEQEG